MLHVSKSFYFRAILCWFELDDFSPTVFLTEDKWFLLIIIPDHLPSFNQINNKYIALI